MNGTESRGREHSPRPGFTLVGGLPGAGPVVVRVDGSRESFGAMRTAANHAMSRSCGLVIIGRVAGPVPSPDAVFDDLDERERAVAVGILRNSHVTLVPRASPVLDDVLEQCYVLGASLLVLNRREIEALGDNPELLGRVLGARFDLLMITTEGGEGR